MQTANQRAGVNFHVRQRRLKVPTGKSSLCAHTNYSSRMQWKFPPGCKEIVDVGQKRAASTDHKAKGNFMVTSFDGSLQARNSRPTL